MAGSAVLDAGGVPERSRSSRERLLEWLQLNELIGADGQATRLAERIPGLGNLISEVHHLRGLDDQARRADESNPMGTNGFLTKTAECIPGVSDAIRCIHQFRGEDEAAERARGNSLGKYLSKDGALTKTAELLPGSNLVAAVLLETSGNHREAKRALNLLQNWRDMGSADGALAKVAEMFPGTDLIAFGLHCSHHQFARAIRSVAKTRWVDITANSLSIEFTTSTVGKLRMVQVLKDDLSVHPIAVPLVGALLDVCLKMFWEHAAEAGDQVKAALINLKGAPHLTKMITCAANAHITETLQTQTAGLKGSLQHALDAASVTLGRKREGNALLRPLLPAALPMPTDLFIAELQRALPDVTVVHDTVPVVRRISARYREYRRGFPETAGAISCLSFLGCMGFGLPTGALACFTGCLAGAGQAVRAISTQLVPRLNGHNAEAWRATAQSPEGCRLHRRPPADDPFRGVVVEVPDVPHLSSSLSHYVLRDLLSSWPFGRFCRQLVECIGPPLLAFLVDLVRAKGDGPQLVVRSAVPEQHMKVGTSSLTVPSIPFAVLFDLDLDIWGSRSLLRRARVVFADAAIDETLASLREQLPGIDFRSLDHGLAGFTEPLSLNCDLGLEWLSSTVPAFQVRDMSMRLHLPD